MGWKRGESTGYLVGYGEEKGRNYWILNKICRGRGEKILNT